MKSIWNYEDLKLQGFSDHQISLILEGQKKLIKPDKKVGEEYFPEKKPEKSCGRCSYKHNIPLLYLYVFKLMTDKMGMVDQITTTKQLLEFWHRNIYNVPRRYDFHLLDEMCRMGLLEKINTQKYRFYGGKAQHKLKRLRDNFLW